MEELPAGTVTFLFTDVERSTELVQRLGDAAYGDLLKTHRALLRTAFTTHHGREVDTQGDAFFVVFADARDAVRAALAIQDALATHPWPPGAHIRVRTGLHSGTAVIVGNAYVGVDVHRAHRICAVGHGGQVVLSQVTSLLVADALPAGVRLQDLGDHRLRDLRRPERIFQVVHPHLPPALPPLRSLSVQPHNLPVQLTSFIGRDREIAEVKHLLAGTRLLTLTGPGGSGKTRLALQAAAELLPAHPDGVWLVELATLTDPDLARSAVAGALGVREQTGRPLQATLAETLKHKHFLLILDNCEHLVKTCAEIAEWLLRAVPNLTILATSRERLGAAGETSYLVPPLSVPDVRGQQPLEDLVKTEAVRLFIERAASIQPGFSLTPATAADVARIVQTLDGIPLAIELAAARVNVLSVPQIAERLHDRFQLLTAGGRTAAPRQRTLEATMDWSYDLLSEPERVLLRRLSVFAGGFTLEAAEAVCADGRVPRSSILDLVTNLVDKSLVVTIDTDGERRHRMLDTVHQYGWDRLQSSGESGTIQDRHQQYFLAFAEQAEANVRGSAQRRWLDRLETEHDNLRAALEWAKSKPAVDDPELRLAGALWLFWYVRAYWKEGRAWLEGALARRTKAPPRARTKALYAAGLLAWMMGDDTDAERLSNESLALSRRLRDGVGIACSLLTLALVARRRKQYEEATALHEESLALFRRLSDAWGTALSLRLLGILMWHRGDYARATAFLEESLTLCRTQADLDGIASSLHGLGRVAAYQMEYARAEALLKESLVLFRELGDREGIAVSLHVLGNVAMGRQLHSDAILLYAAAAALRKAIGAPLPTVDQDDYDRHINDARASLGEPAFSALWNQAHALPLEEGIARALGRDDSGDR